MFKRRLFLPAFAILLAGFIAWPSDAQDEDGYNAATYLLRQTTQPYRDGRHNAMLRSLRQLNDDDLLPLLNALSLSKYPAQRVHGMLGAAELSPERRLDLTVLAEIENDRELIEVLSVAMDNQLIDKGGLATLLQWEQLQLAVKQAIAIRLVAKGGVVETDPFRASLDVELSETLGAAPLLQYTLAAIVLAQTGDPAGKPALEKLAQLQGPSSDAVLAQIIDGAMQHEMSSVAPIALTVAKDDKRGVSLRMLAMQCALQLNAKGAGQAWQVMYANETEPARRIRLALIALDAAANIDAGLFDMLTASDDTLLRQVGLAGKAIATNSAQVPKAFEDLIALGQPLVNGWVVSYCRRDEPAHYPALLALVIKHHRAGETRNRGRLAEAAINAVQTLCEADPDQAAKGLIGPLMDSAGQDAAGDNPLLALRQIILVGIARSHGSDLTALAKSITPDEHDDFTTQTLRLLIRARYNASLTKDEWVQISDIVQGVGQTDLGLRVQLAWLYLKHMGKADQAIKDALK